MSDKDAAIAVRAYVDQLRVGIETPMSLQWTSDRDTSSPPEIFSAVAPKGDRGQWLKEMWRFFRSHVIPLNASVAWDHVYVEIAPEVGRVLVFPSRSGHAARVEDAGCSLVLPSVRSRYEELADLEDEDAFVEQLNAEMVSLAGEILTCASALHEPPDAIPHSLRIRVWEPAADEPLAERTV